MNGCCGLWVNCNKTYTNERDGLIRDIGIISDLLKKIREKRLHYEQMQIEEINQTGILRRTTDSGT